jgi:hypothetical protein
LGDQITHLKFWLRWETRQRTFVLSIYPVALTGGISGNGMQETSSTGWPGKWLNLPQDGAKRFSPKKLALVLGELDATLQQQRGDWWDAAQEVLAKNDLRWVESERVAA